MHALLIRPDEKSFHPPGCGLNGFLFDENIPIRLTFTPGFPVFHATELGRGSTDSTVWQHAKPKGHAIVTKDADFSSRVMVSHPPPWVVHLRFGNLRGAEYHVLLGKVWPEIESLLPHNKLITVYPDRIEALG